MNDRLLKALKWCWACLAAFALIAACVTANKTVEKDIHGQPVTIPSGDQIKHPGQRFVGDADKEPVWACFDDVDHPGDILCSSWAESISIANGIMKDRAEREQKGKSEL